ncbi:HlyD family secretion protein [Novosphingobium sp. KCTC 2891]|uniref:HlyD family secretion protein n=1 Tax=Novosphingobium sp. KCTC 2891 TaxID=2989730 RepID=UPI0022226528|nr:HlyD family secretion protein [Novosphingobium sp. KCTC 2891]MCW1383574.1 HlyD family secretion protein [Novosphingobium sp. KCTC 2891]
MTTSFLPAPKQMIRLATTGALVLAALIGGKALITYYESDPWTRDGRVRADIVQVAPDVAGLVTQVYVTHDQKVHRGDVLFEIDPSRYKLALQQATTQIDEAQASAASARAAAMRAMAKLAEARREASRNRGLGDLVAAETTEQSETSVAEGQAALAEARAAQESAAAKLEVARDARNLALLNLSRTRVVAPIDGTLSDMPLRVGNYVSPGNPVMALIDIASLRVEGYFEETKLPRVHIGQAATVRLMGEKKALTGHVVSIAAAIEDHDRSATKNLLPAINPTFSWVRLAQRIPVRIKLDNPPADIALIAGRTGSVSLTMDDKR